MHTIHAGILPAHVNPPAGIWRSQVRGMALIYGIYVAAMLARSRTPKGHWASAGCPLRPRHPVAAGPAPAAGAQPAAAGGRLPGAALRARILRALHDRHRPGLPGRAGAALLLPLIALDRGAPHPAAAPVAGRGDRYRGIVSRPAQDCGKPNFHPLPSSSATSV